MKNPFISEVLAGLKTAAYVFLYPFYSLLAPGKTFALFFPWFDGWRAFLWGPVIHRVEKPKKQFIPDYLRYFFLKPGNIVIDVGGEKGHETRQFAELVGPSGKVFTFECFPQHVEGLKLLTSNYPNVTLIPNACWHQKTTLSLMVGRSPGSNTVIAGSSTIDGRLLAPNPDNKILVPADTLDNLLRDHLDPGTPVDFLKMDIEGAEVEALQGADLTLQRTRHVVIAAYHVREGKFTYPWVAKFLNQRGFKVRTDDNGHVYAWNRNVLKTN